MTGQSTPISTRSKVYLYIRLVRTDIDPVDITGTYDELRHAAGAALCKLKRAEAGSLETGDREEGGERVVVVGDWWSAAARVAERARRTDAE